MVQASIIHLQLLLLIPVNLPDAVILLIGGVCAFGVAYLLSWGVGACCRRLGWLDYPAERRVHKKAVPRLGGVAIFLAFAVVSYLFYAPGPKSNPNEIAIYWLLIAAGGLMVIVHAYDDVLGLGPWPKLIAQTIAVIIILGPWGGVFHGILLFTFNNPFGKQFANPHLPWWNQPTLFLFIH